jgi:GNAT superfamily N-acetyltransferase
MILYRRACPSDLDACVRVRPTSIAHYRSVLGLPYDPGDLRALRDLLGHMLRTDPNLFWVATEDRGVGGPSVAGFAAATRRGPVWFLGALFIDPHSQGKGIGNALLSRVSPGQPTVVPAAGGPILATCTDCLQPISNALYARLGIVPRAPVLRLAGDIGIRALTFRSIAMAEQSTAEWKRQQAQIDELDRCVLGFAHPDDHDFVREQSLGGHLIWGADNSFVGYGYVQRDGALGPVAVADAHDLFAVVAQLASLYAIDRISLWVAGEASDTIQRLLSAGMRLDGYPALACWSAPFADFARYVPGTLTLL